MILLVPNSGLYRFKDDHCSVIVDFTNEEQTAAVCQVLGVSRVGQWPTALATAVRDQWKMDVSIVPTSQRLPPEKLHVEKKPFIRFVLSPMGTLTVLECSPGIDSTRGAVRPGLVISEEVANDYLDAVRARVRSWFDGDIHIEQEKQAFCSPFFQFVISRGERPGVRLQGDVPLGLRGGRKRMTPWGIKEGVFTRSHVLEQVHSRYLQFRCHVTGIIQEGDEAPLLRYVSADAEARRKSLEE